MFEAVVFKKTIFRVSCCLLGMCTVLCFCGCSNSHNVINTHKMPGHKIKEMLNKTTPSKATKNDAHSPLTRTKSGVYIYKDESVVNTSGYKFHIKDKTDLGPSDVRFDAEHFRTRY